MPCMNSILNRHKSNLYSGVTNCLIVLKYTFYWIKSFCYNLFQQLNPLTIFSKIFYIFVELHIVRQKIIIFLRQWKIYTTKSHSMFYCIFICIKISFFNFPRKWFTEKIIPHMEWIIFQFLFKIVNNSFILCIISYINHIKYNCTLCNIPTLIFPCKI